MKTKKNKKSLKKEKVQIYVEGQRGYCFPEDKEKATSRLQSLHDEKPKWPKGSWKSVFHKTLQTEFKVGSWGGARRSPKTPCPQLLTAASSAAAASGAAQKQSKKNSSTAASGAAAAGGAETNIWQQKELVLKPIELAHSESDHSATYVCDGAIAIMQALPGLGDAAGIPFTPQPVVNFLYQALCYALSVLQKELGCHGRFHADGHFRSLDSHDLASGGEVCAFWGTEMGSRRDQALIAWDYDVDLAVFITDDFDLGGLWRRVSEKMVACCLRCFEHNPGFKFRMSPDSPLAWTSHRERYQETRLEHPGTSRSQLLRMAARAKAAGVPIKHPSGCNCVDVEVYRVVPNKPIQIKGSQTFEVDPSDMFPIVEGIFGPLRIPLPRTPVCLDREYGGQWRHARVCKRVSNGGKGKEERIPGDSVRRCAWPSVPLESCEHLRCGYSGAGPRASPGDMPWRFHGAGK